MAVVLLRHIFLYINAEAACMIVTVCKNTCISSQMHIISSWNDQTLPGVSFVYHRAMICFFGYHPRFRMEGRSKLWSERKLFDLDALDVRRSVWLLWALWLVETVESLIPVWLKLTASSFFLFEGILLWVLLMDPRPKMTLGLSSLMFARLVH